jgi:hypothetical protein
MTRSLHARFLWALRQWNRELETDFELLRMSRSRQVGYRQSVDLPDGTITYTSILRYLGLSMQTDFSLVLRDEIEDVAASLRDLCERFWTAATHGFEDRN